MCHTFTPKSMGAWQGRFAQAVMGLGLLLLVVESFSLSYGGFAPQWTMQHCPQGQAHGGHHSHSQCVCGIATASMFRHPLDEAEAHPACRLASSQVLFRSAQWSQGSISGLFPEGRLLLPHLDQA